MRKIVFFIVALLFLGILGIGYFVGNHFFFGKHRVVILTSIDPSTGQITQKGMGYYINNDILITSAHVVSDDRSIYRTMSIAGVMSENLSVQMRFSERDIAFLNTGETGISHTIKTILVDPDVSIGDQLSIPLFRSGSLVWTQARIASIDTQILAYDARGQIRIFSGIILPDTPFLPGDSGAPIFTKWGKLIDVVHIE